MPPTRSRHATRISRRSPSHEPPHVGNGIRPSLKKKDLCVGCIVWLPEKLESDKSLVCSRGKSCCDGKKLDDDGYNHPVVILCYEGSICYIAMITSKTRKKYHVATRIPISQKPQDMDNLDPEVKLYLEIGEMNKQSFIIIEHLFPIPLSMLRSISFKPDSRAFDTRLCKQSSLDLANMFNLNETRVKWVDTAIVKAKEVNSTDRSQRKQRGKRVTFGDPWEEIRGNTTEANLTTPSQRTHSKPTLSSTSTPTLPATRNPQTQITPPVPSTREWFTYDYATDRYNQRELTAERQSLLQHPSPFPNNPLPAQQTWHQQYHTVTPARPARSNYHATLPSVEQYYPSHWDSRIRNSNTRTRDLERGRASSVGDGAEGGCNGGIFVRIVVVFLGVVGFIGWLYGKWI